PAELDARAVKVPSIQHVVVRGEDLGEAAVGVVVKVNQGRCGDLLLVAGQGFGRPVEAAVGKSLRRGCHRPFPVTTSARVVKTESVRRTGRAAPSGGDRPLRGASPSGPPRGRAMETRLTGARPTTSCLPPRRRPVATAFLAHFRGDAIPESSARS